MWTVDFNMICSHLSSIVAFNYLHTALICLVQITMPEKATQTYDVIQHDVCVQYDSDDCDGKGRASTVAGDDAIMSLASASLPDVIMNGCQDEKTTAEINQRLDISSPAAMTSHEPNVPHSAKPSLGRQVDEFDESSSAWRVPIVDDEEENEQTDPAYCASREAMLVDISAIPRRLDKQTAFSKTATHQEDNHMVPNEMSDRLPDLENQSFYEDQIVCVGALTDYEASPVADREGQKSRSGERCDVKTFDVQRQHMDTDHSNLADMLKSNKDYKDENSQKTVADDVTDLTVVVQSAAENILNCLAPSVHTRDQSHQSDATDSAVHKATQTLQKSWSTLNHDYTSSSRRQCMSSRTLECYRMRSDVNNDGDDVAVDDGCVVLCHGGNVTVMYRGQPEFELV